VLWSGPRSTGQAYLRLASQREKPTELFAKGSDEGAEIFLVLIRGLESPRHSQTRMSALRQNPQSPVLLLKESILIRVHSRPFAVKIPRFPTKLRSNPRLERFGNTVANSTIIFVHSADSKARSALRGLILQSYLLILHTQNLARHAMLDLYHLNS